MQLDIKDIDSAQKTGCYATVGENSAFASVYKQIGQRVSLPGFRRGKVPVGHLRKKFARDAASEVLQVLVEKGWRGVLEDGKIMPLSEPKFDLSPVVEGKATPSA